MLKLEMNEEIRKKKERQYVDRMQKFHNFKSYQTRGARDAEGVL